MHSTGFKLILKERRNIQDGNSTGAIIGHYCSHVARRHLAAQKHETLLDRFSIPDEPEPKAN